ncbi:uncharacterized protein LOC135098512 [Scylla paramamosain]|uniref:uncharacterized protein LOC135098512 n=1 Tax=Scylla paramamosain TaxID=85552 RepID=UPI003083AA15
MEVIKYNDFSNARLLNSRRQWCDRRSNLITLSSLVGCWRWREHGLCLWWHHCRRWQARRRHRRERAARAPHPAMASSQTDSSEELFRKCMTHRPTQKLVVAVQDGGKARVRSAIARGANPKVTIPTDAGVSVCLVTVAASKGHHHLLRCLLQAGLSMEGGGTTDRTPLMEAAEKGHTQTVKALLTLGANPLATDSKEWTALHHAAVWGQQQSVAALTPVTPPTPAHLEALTPVHAASYRGHVEVLEQLAGAGWPLTARDSDGDTPLHHAAVGDSVTCQEWLEQRGGDPRVQNKAGHTPMDKVGSGEGHEGEGSGRAGREAATLLHHHHHHHHHTTLTRRFTKARIGISKARKTLLIYCYQKRVRISSQKRVLSLTSKSDCLYVQ